MGYYVSRQGQQFGPYHEAQLQQYIAEGRFLWSDVAWTEGMVGWIPLSAIFRSSAAAQAALPKAPLAATIMGFLGIPGAFVFSLHEYVQIKTLGFDLIVFTLSGALMGFLFASFLFLILSSIAWPQIIARTIGEKYPPRNYTEASMFRNLLTYWAFGPPLFIAVTPWLVYFFHSPTGDSIIGFLIALSFLVPLIFSVVFVFAQRAYKQSWTLAQA